MFLFIYLFNPSSNVLSACFSFRDLIYVFYNDYIKICSLIGVCK